MTDRVAERRTAIGSFAAELRDLRERAGNPPFREMAGRSRAISHTTLHEAARGHRLPSWATTAEFVKACGADPVDYRQRWSDADRAARALARQPAEEHPPSDDVAADIAPLDTQPATRSRERRRRMLLIGSAAVIAIAVASGVALLVRGSGSGSSDGAATSADPARFVAADCPVHPADPAAAPARHHGDMSVFIDDITLPDCSLVRHGATVRKVWRIKNIGTTRWSGYSLHRLDLPRSRNDCRTADDIAVPATAPDSTVDIATMVTAPSQPGFCFVRFKMLDAEGNVAFPGRRPLNFQLIID